MLTNLTNSKYHVGIRGTGYYVPERVVTNKELEQYVDTTDEWIQQKIGIKERRIASESETTSDLAYKAAIMAMDDAGIKAEDIDLIILNCLCPDHRDPATACLVHKKIGATNAAAFDLSVGGCPGPVYALNIATNFINNGSCKNVLIIGADTVATTFVDWTDRNTCCFFGDGAGAVVVGRSSKQGIRACSMYADGRGYDRIQAPNINPQNSPGNAPISRLPEGKSPYLYMDGKGVYNFAINAFPESIRELVNEVGIGLHHIDLVIPHQANINIIKQGMSKLDLPFEKAFVNIHKYGNTTSASIFIALAEAVREGRISAGSTVAISAFGAGLAWGAVLLEWVSKEDFI